MAKNKIGNKLALQEFKNSMTKIRASIDAYKDNIKYLRNNNSIIIKIVISLAYSFICKRTRFFEVR